MIERLLGKKSPYFKSKEALKAGVLPNGETLSDNDRLLLNFLIRAGKLPYGLGLNFGRTDHLGRIRRKRLKSTDYDDGEIQMFLIDPKHDPSLKKELANVDIPAIRERIIGTVMHGTGLRGDLLRTFVPTRVLFKLLNPFANGEMLARFQVYGWVYPWAVQPIIRQEGEAARAFGERVLQTITQPDFMDKFPKLPLTRGLLRHHWI